MTELLCRLFVKNRDNTRDPATRRSYGMLTGVVGIILNVLLFVGKFIAGTIAGSVSICADALNNLSDAGSQGISLVSFRIAAKPADRKHPFGHARIEYVASMIVSMLILVIGYQLLRDSIDKIIHPEATEFRILSVIILSVSILVKLWLGLFNRKIGQKIDSEVMKATMTDSLSDAAATTAVLLSALIAKFTGFDPDAYMGVVVAVIILIAGIKILNESKNTILGEAPDEETVAEVKRIVNSFPETKGIHDLAVHNYGPDRHIVTLHVEVDGSQNIFDTHDAIDRMERELWKQCNIHATIHMDPIVTGDAAVTALRDVVRNTVKNIDERMDIHDFRMVKGPTHSNLIFDVVAPFELKMSNQEISNEITRLIQEIDKTFCAVVTVDRA